MSLDVYMVLCAKISVWLWWQPHFQDYISFCSNRNILLLCCFIINCVIDSTFVFAQRSIKRVLHVPRDVAKRSIKNVLHVPREVAKRSIKSVLHVPREVAKRSIKSVLHVPREVAKRSMTSIQRNNQDKTTQERRRHDVISPPPTPPLTPSPTPPQNPQKKQQKPNPQHT